MHQKRFVLCSATALLAIAVACSKSPATPSAPGSTQDVSGEAAADGSTLKVLAPTTVSPINNAQPDSLVLVASRVTGKFNLSLNPSYQFEIRRSGAAVSGCTTIVAPGSGSTTSYTPSCALEFDTAHTWRVRGVFLQGSSGFSSDAFGPWSSDAAFRSPSGGYINGNELFDPLTNGKTVGTRVGGTQFTPDGIELLGHDSRVTYELPRTLEEGEFSLMAKGYDEGSPGDKTKIMSMQEGGGDITTNDYRFTVEKRGRDYSVPGAVTFRVITGGGDSEIRDGARLGVAFSDERWYFWRVTWRNGRVGVEVKEDGPNGRAIYNQSTGTSGHPYRPVPHMIHLGAPVGRAGPGDASIPGAIYKNVWVSSRPRPTFPGE